LENRRTQQSAEKQRDLERHVAEERTKEARNIEDVGALISMAATGNPYENGEADSFFRTLKTEEVYALKAGSAL
jgi:transposase InsO family protein